MNKSVIEEYISKVYVLVMLTITGACLCAGVTFSALKLMGSYSEVSWTPLIIFCSTCVLYLLIGLWFIRFSFAKEDGVKTIIPQMLKRGKLFIVLLEFIQFNFILYMIPSRDFWAYIAFFLMLTVFFFDFKLTLICSLGVTASLVISWFVKADMALPVKDELFISDVVLRIVGVLLSVIALNMITLLADKFLINAKKAELKKNNERVQNVLGKVTSLAEKLGESSNSLSEVAQNQSASTEELAATSESLLSSNNTMLRRSKSSIENLRELGICNNEMSEKMSMVDGISQKLLEESTSNEARLNELMTINEQVMQTTDNTRNVAKKLLNGIGKVGIALNVIDDISFSTNILALNASIEAARAGEAGRGFAVVANEVGDLAKNTQNSLDEVQKVIRSIQDDVSAMVSIVNDNANKLLQQNESFNEAFEGVKNMIVILKQSLNAINEITAIHQKQRNVIEQTNSINEDISNAIAAENQDFNGIAATIDSNAQEISKMAMQVDILKNMIEELEALL